MALATILKNRDMSATVEAISTKFGTVMQLYPLDRSDRWKIEIMKIHAEIWYMYVWFPLHGGCK